MKFFTSDIHLGDEWTLKSDLRPFKDVKHFNKHIVKQWNKQAKKSDVIYVVGDFIDCDGDGHDNWKNYLPWVNKFKADIVLITGNNEDRVVKYYFNNDFESFREYCLKLGFKEVYKNLKLEVCGKTMFLTHKPMDCDKNYINLFGHTHAAGGIYRPFGLNVGCDLFCYRLLSEKDIEHLLNKKSKFWNKDKHLNNLNLDIKG